MPDESIVSMAEKDKRMSLRAPLILGAVGFAVCGVAFLAFGLYILWDSSRLINFLAAWIPFVLSVLFAFVPSGKDMKHPWIKWGWRCGVVIIGFCWSVMLWHQQDLTDKANVKQIQDAVEKSVTDANNHSDEKIGGVQKQVETVEQNLDDTKTEISAQLGKTETNITNSIGKVGKPAPPELAQLQVSLWEEGQDVASEPVETESITQNTDGSVTVQFLIRNVSDVGAEDPDLWVLICAQCAYTKEPDGFEKPPDIGIGQERHIHIHGTLNPGVAFKILSVSFKSDVFSSPYAIGFKDSCTNCGAIKPLKKFIVNVEPTSTLLSPQ